MNQDFYRPNNIEPQNTTDTKQKSKLILYLIPLIFFLVGTGFIIGSVFIHSNTAYFIKNGVITGAVILSIEKRAGSEKTFIVTVEYEVNGVTYKNNLGAYSSGMKEGQTVPIRYIPDNPNKIAYAKNEYLLFIIFLSIGVILFFTSFIIFYIFKEKNSYNTSRRGN